MMQHNQQAVQVWLDQLHAADTLTKDEETELLFLMGSEGLGALIKLMMGARQALYVSLANTALVDEAARARASVIQGKIAGIDMLPQTLLELVMPAQAGTNGAKDQQHG